MVYLPLLSTTTTLALLLPQAAAVTGPAFTVTVDSMPKVLFTGDSQSCGRNLALDFPQLLSRELPARVLNTAVGGSNSSALLYPQKGGTVRLRQGERVLYGENVLWGMGPFPGMRVEVSGESYTIDFIDEHPGGKAELHLCEAARADYAGPGCAVEPGWEVRVAQHRPDVVCLMYVNDRDMPEAKQRDWREMVARIRALGAVPVLMSPVPYIDRALGADHPGDHHSVLANAAAVRTIAAAEKAWFVDVTQLYFALDPGLRGVIGDTIHPDTDGSTLIVNGLRWVFEQMGLTAARPFTKGWVLTGAVAPLPELLSGGVRPFRTSQPDHPDADHQQTEGFTLAAIRDNDEYGLIAARDGLGLPVGPGILLRLGLPETAAGAPVDLRLAGAPGLAADVWTPAAQAWQVLSLEARDGWLRARLPGQGVVEEGQAHVLIRGPAGAVLDAVAFDLQGVTDPGRWTPGPVPPAAYNLQSDHDRGDNLVPNADFTRGDAVAVEGWELSGSAKPNRASRCAIGPLAFADAKDLHLVEVQGEAPAREFDRIEIRGSKAGNDGVYLVWQKREDGRLRLRRKGAAPEAGLCGELIHNDGCGLVPGGACVETSAEGRAMTRVALPAGTARLRLSFFHRAFDPKALGTRQVPQDRARVTVTFRADDGQVVGTPFVMPAPPASYQWQKAEAECPVPPGRVESVALEFAGTGPSLMQFTGAFLGPVPAAATPSPRSRGDQGQ